MRRSGCWHSRLVASTVAPIAGRAVLLSATVDQLEHASLAHVHHDGDVGLDTPRRFSSLTARRAMAAASACALAAASALSLTFLTSLWRPSGSSKSKLRWASEVPLH